MTAVCTLEDDPDLSEEFMVDRADTRGASSRICAPTTVSLNNLLHLALVASDNAARGCWRGFAPGLGGFVARMNEKAPTRPATRTTSTVGPAGDNVSSAYDMARLISYAAGDPVVSGIMRTEKYSFRTSRRAITIHSTNQLLRTANLDVLGGKTGFISRSGYCLVSLPPPAGAQPVGGRGRARRAVERRPVLGNRHLLNWINAGPSSCWRRGGQVHNLRSSNREHLPLSDGGRGFSPADKSLRQVPALQSRRVQRQRGDGVDVEHERPIGFCASNALM